MYIINETFFSDWCAVGLLHLTTESYFKQFCLSFRFRHVMYVTENTITGIWCQQYQAGYTGKWKPNCASAPVVFPINASKIIMWSHFIFSWVWKRPCWNRNRYNWNELDNANIAVIHYGKRNWYILRQLWRMYQIKGRPILQFAAVPIHVMLVIIRQYQFCCVVDYNHVHYTAHIFWSRYAYSGKHHAMLVRLKSDCSAAFCFGASAALGKNVKKQQEVSDLNRDYTQCLSAVMWQYFSFRTTSQLAKKKQYFENSLSILIFRKLPMPNLHLLWEWVFTSQGCVQTARLCRGSPVNFFLRSSLLQRQ